jgi:hypothetical protein
MQASRPIPTSPVIPGNIGGYEYLSSSSSVICRLKSWPRCLRLQELVVGFVAAIAGTAASRACSTGVSASTLHLAPPARPVPGRGLVRAGHPANPRLGAGAHAARHSSCYAGFPAPRRPRRHRVVAASTAPTPPRPGHRRVPEESSSGGPAYAPCQPPRTAAGVPTSALLSAPAGANTAPASPAPHARHQLRLPRRPT